MRTRIDREQHAGTIAVCLGTSGLTRLYGARYGWTIGIIETQSWVVVVVSQCGVNKRRENVFTKRFAAASDENSTTTTTTTWNERAATRNRDWTGYFSKARSDARELGERTSIFQGMKDILKECHWNDRFTDHGSSKDLVEKRINGRTYIGVCTENCGTIIVWKVIHVYQKKKRYRYVRELKKLEQREKGTEVFEEIVGADFFGILSKKNATFEAILRDFTVIRTTSLVTIHSHLQFLPPPPIKKLSKRKKTK